MSFLYGRDLDFLQTLMGGRTHHKFHSEHFNKGSYVTKTGVVTVWRKMWMKDRNQIDRVRRQKAGTFWPIRNVLAGAGK